jgi:preprotein translocase subunit YajC
MNLFVFLLQAETETPQGLFGGGLSTMVFFGLIFVVFYFFMIRPQQKKAKEERAFRDSLQKGDKVATIGGIHGQVESIEENTALVRVDSNTKLRFDKAALKPIATADSK